MISFYILASGEKSIAKIQPECQMCLNVPDSSKTPFLCVLLTISPCDCVSIQSQTYQGSLDTSAKTNVKQEYALEHNLTSMHLPISLTFKEPKEMFTFL